MKYKPSWRAIAIFILATTLFALAYNQSPLYTSNQYQYFLHGLARAGLGTLSEDWLVNTLDPTPVFSLLVEITTRIQAEGLFYLYYALMMGIYLFSLVAIANTTFQIRKSPHTFYYFIAGMILLHSAGLHYLLSILPGADWTYLFEGGVAGQRLLGPVFQPSIFGILLLVSISFHLQRRPYLASLFAVLAATIHPTYLLSSAILIVTYCIDLFFLEHRKSTAIGVALFSLAAVGPILIYTFLIFVGGSPEIAARAQEILVNIRIPHHARIAEWFDAAVVVKLILLGTALYLARGTRLFFLILVPLSFSILLTLVQWISGNLTLALLFPWRLSAWLMPIAPAIILAKLTLRLTNHFQGKRDQVLKTLGVLSVVLAVCAGLGRTWLDSRELDLSPALPLETYIAEHRQPGEVYLIPVKMFDFRLNAGVPVYGDFFSIPYKDEEVIEWYSRFLNAKHFYEKADCKLLDEFHEQGVTHVVLPVDFPTPCRAVLTPLYEDDAYRLFLLDMDS